MEAVVLVVEGLTVLVKGLAYKAGCISVQEDTVVALEIDAFSGRVKAQ